MAFSLCFGFFVLTSGGRIVYLTSDTSLFNVFPVQYFNFAIVIALRKICDICTPYQPIRLQIFSRHTINRQYYPFNYIIIIMKIQFAGYSASENRSLLISIVYFSGRLLQLSSSSSLNLLMSSERTTDAGRLFHSVAARK